MVFSGQKIFSDKTLKNRIFTEIYTAKWWHILQVRILPTGPLFLALTYAQSHLPQGATLTPIIIATDKTQLTQFSGNKSAYPVYLTIGNIPKATR